MAGRFSVEAVFRAVDRVTAPVSRMQNRVSMFTRSMGNGFHRLNRTVGRFASGVKKGAIAVVAALALSGAALADVVRTGAQFEQTLVNAAAKFPGEIRRGTLAFKELEAAAKTTGSTTEFTASQAAAALNFLAMAGFDSVSSIAALPGVVDLATASQVDLATATDVASDSLGAFGLMTKDATQLGTNLARVNDVIAKTTTSANTTVEGLFETIKDGAPVATTAGASLETFAALAGELANSGIKGTRAGTTLKNMFLSLSAPTDKAAKILRRLGVNTKDSNGDMLDIIEVLDTLGISLDGLGTADRSGVLEGIFGKIPIAGVNILLASGSEKLREFRKELEGASGASSDMAGIMRDTLQGRLNSLTSAIEGVKISIFSMSNGPLADAIEKTTAYVRANEELIATNVGGFIADLINNFSGIVTVIKQIAIGLAVLFALTTVLKTIAVVMTVVNLVMAANPIVLIVLAVIAAVAAFTALVAYIDTVAGAFKKLPSFIRLMLTPLEMVIRAIKFIKDTFNGGFGSAFSKLKVGLGFTSDEEATSGADTVSQVITPQDRTARSIQEMRSSSSAEVTIRDETGRAEVTGGTMGQGLLLQQTGAF